MLAAAVGTDHPHRLVPECCPTIIRQWWPTASATLTRMFGTGVVGRLSIDPNEQRRMRCVSSELPGKR